MPFYNAEKFLDESLGSIMRQTFKNFEVILINDASNDNSDKIVQRYLEDKRIQYIKNTMRKGIVANLNRGLDLAKSNIIARMDGDDIALKERFHKQFNFLQKNTDVALVGSYVKTIDENGNDIQEIKKPTSNDDIRKVCFYYGPFVHPSVMFRKKSVSEVGNYRQEYEYTEDVDLFLRLIYSGYITANIPEVLLKYRQHGDSTSKHSKEIGRKSFRLKKELIKKYDLHLDFKSKTSIYIHYILDMSLSGKQKRQLQLRIKRIVGG